VETELQPYRHLPLARTLSVSARARWRVLVRHLTPFGIALAVYLAAFLAMRPPTTGDEPHYLLVAQSLVLDGDFDLANDYASRERTLEVYGAFPLEQWGHAADFDGSGLLRPVHGLGVSLLVAPAVSVGGLNGARLVMIVIAALLAHQLFRLLDDLGFQRFYLSLAWAAVAFCLPLLVYSNQIFPEVAAGLLAVVALRLMLRRPTSLKGVAAGSIAGALLIWLNIRYFPLAGGILLGLAYAACSPFRAETSRTLGGKSPKRTWWRAKATALDYRRIVTARWRVLAVALLGPYVLSVSLLAAIHARWYGSLSPGAPFRPFWDNSPGDGGLTFWYDFALANLLDPRFGLIPYGPVHWLAIAALGCLIIRFGRPAVAGIAVVAGYWLLIESIGVPAGWGFPGRFLVSVVPVAAIPLAVALQQVRAVRVLAIPVLGLSVVVALSAVAQPELLYPVATPRTTGAKHVAGAFPEVREFPDSFAVTPGQYLYLPEVPQFPARTGRVANARVVAREGKDKPGHMLWGPFTALASGRYRATFLLAASGVENSNAVATIEVIGEPPETILAQRVVHARELTSKPRGIPLDFGTSGNFLIQTRVAYHGRGTVTAGPARAELKRPAATRDERFGDWPIAFIWAIATGLLGGLFVKRMR
jgi:hypothetical protein